MLCETHVLIIFIFIFIFIYNKLLLSITNMMSIHDDVEYNYDVMKWHIYITFIYQIICLFDLFFPFLFLCLLTTIDADHLNSIHSIHSNQIKSNQMNQLTKLHRLALQHAPLLPGHNVGALNPQGIPWLVVIYSFIIFQLFFLVLF